MAEARPFADDAPPTVVLDDVRITNPSNWPHSGPSTPYPTMPPPQPVMGQPQFGAYIGPQPPSQALAIVSLCTGIASVTVGWCCSTGILLAPVALITGFMALSKIKNDPQNFSGRGMALTGIITGVIYFSLLILFVIVYGLAIIGGSLG